jgi:hypothetical protein
MACADLRKLVCGEGAAVPVRHGITTHCVCRRFASEFLSSSFFRSPDERSEIRAEIEAERSSPDFASLHPGYMICEADVARIAAQAPPPAGPLLASSRFT